MANIFHNKSEIKDPIQLIDEYVKLGGSTSGKIKDDFYEDCKQLTDTRSLNSCEKNLLILNDCLLEKQNKAEANYI